MDADNILKHPLFDSSRFEPEDDDYRKVMEKVRLEHIQLQKRIDALLISLNGEEGWMLTNKENEDAC
jgi:hypothetical protein